MTSGSVTRTATALTRCGPPDRNQPRSEIHAPAIRQFDVAIHQRTTILSPMAFYDVFGPGGQAAGQLRWLWHWNSPSVRGRVTSQCGAFASVRASCPVVPSIHRLSIRCTRDPRAKDGNSRRGFSSALVDRGRFSYAAPPAGSYRAIPLGSNTGRDGSPPSCPRWSSRGGHSREHDRG
jgi:hypothetical protein